MKQFKGTKGKWRIIEKQVPHTGGLILEVHEFQNNLQGCIIGRVTTNNYEARRANAQLIAAAPELLENLLRIVDRLEECDLQHNFPSAYERAKKSINKALGQ